MAKYAYLYVKKVETRMKKTIHSEALQNAQQIVSIRQSTKGLFIIEAGPEGKASISTDPGDVVIMVGPREPKTGLVDQGENTLNGRYYTYHGKLEDLPTDLNPDLILMVCPNPIDIEDMVTQAALVAGTDTSLVAVLDTESNEMQRFGVNAALEYFILTAGSTGWQYTDRTASSLYDLLNYFVEIDRDAYVNSRMHPTDAEQSYRYIVATDFNPTERQQLITSHPHRYRSLNH